MKKAALLLCLAGCAGRIIPEGAGLELLWNEGAFTEGGAVDASGGILFSDIGDRLMRFDPKTEKTSVFRQPSGKGNGMAFDAQGRLLVCEGGARRVSITDPAGVRTLCDRFEGKRFNSPNDIVVDRQGRAYFTDPRYGSQDGRELDFEGVFLVAPDGKVSLATRELQRPNGIQISPDGRTLYVADNHSDPKGNHHLVAFDIQQPDGALKNKRILHDIGPDKRGIDGMKVDVDGNLYATAGTGAKAGIYIFDPAGRLLEMLPMPGDPTNCVFDGPQLYITAQSPNKRWSLYRIKLANPGFRLSP